VEKAGFMLDSGDDESGLFMKYLRRGRLLHRRRRVRPDHRRFDQAEKRRDVNEIREHSVLLSDGSELPADLIVYATGYGSMNGWAADLIPGGCRQRWKCWALGSNTTKDPGPWEGELRNMWKPTQQESLWFHGGNLHQSRHYSQFLSLQLKARMEGIATPVYGLQQVHHKQANRTSARGGLMRFQ
jgi:putative flavoprotein involved in K+ transport